MTLKLGTNESRFDPKIQLFIIGNELLAQKNLDLFGL